MSDTPDKMPQITPANQANERAGRGGIVPPAHARWKRGQSGNQLGRPPAGMSVKEWINVMQDWPVAKVEKVANDPRSGNAKATAAGIWLDARTRRGNDFDRIMDQTAGKPKQAIDMRMDATMTKGDEVQAAMDRLLSNPEAFSAAEVLFKQLECDATVPSHTQGD